MTEWEVQSEDENKKVIASHSVHGEFIKIDRKKKLISRNICIVQTEQAGKLKSMAQSYEEAFSRGIEACFQGQKQHFMKAGDRHPNRDEQIEFVRTCVDNIECV